MKMKIYLTALLLAAASSLTNAQELPKQGVVLSMEKTNFILTPGTSTEVQVQLLRSKRAKKTKFDGLEARTSNGLTIAFIQDAELMDTYRMSISVAEDAPPKSHTVVVKGLGINSSKLKGKAISINVAEAQIVKSDG